MAELPIKLGPYTLIKKVGRGAFGVVWLAEKRTKIATTQFALKLAHNENLDLDAFKHEAAIWVKASGHPNVVSLIEADVYDDQVALVSEYIPDGSLARWLREHDGKAPSIESGCDIIDGVLGGLAHLHHQKIIHRDLKPDNILLRHEIPHLADFGIARFLQTDSYSANISGTLAYMAPEAFEGKRNERTDLWSVGVIFYQLLAGRLPYPQHDMVSLIGAITRYEPPPLPDSTPEALRKIVMKALQREPSQRYASAKEMRQELRTAKQRLWKNEPEANTSANHQDHGFIPPTVLSVEPPSPPHPIDTITAVYSPVHSGHEDSAKVETPEPKNLFRLTQQNVLVPVLVWGLAGSVSGLVSEVGFDLAKGDPIHMLFPGFVFGVVLFLFGEASSSPSLDRRNRALSFVILVAFSTLGWFLALRTVLVFQNLFSLKATRGVEVFSFVIAGALGGLIIVVGEMLCWRKTLGRWQLLFFIVSIAAISSVIVPTDSNANFYLFFAIWQGLVLAAHAVAHSRNKIWLLSSIAVLITLAGTLFIVNSLIRVSTSTTVQNINSISTPTPTPIPTPDKAQLQIAVDDYLARVAQKTSSDETDKTLRKTVYGDIDGDGDDDAVVQFVLDAKEGNSSAVLLAVFINTDGKFKGANAEYVGGNHLRDFELDSVKAGSIIGTTLECAGDYYPCENAMKRQATIVWKDSKMEVPSRWIQ